MREQALFEAVPAQPMLIAGEPAQELVAAEVAIGGMYGVG